jgi:uncharacterized membrane protein
MLAAAGMAMAWFVSIAVDRWRGYQTSAFDLAFFDQLIWNAAHGRIGHSTFIDYNFLGQHLEPILIVFVPAYWLGGGPLVLTATQAVIAAAAAIPLFFAAKRAGVGSHVCLALAIAYLANPYLHRAIWFDFHPEVMLGLPAFGSTWAIAAQRPRLAVSLALSTLLFKEEAVFIALTLAAVMWWHGLRREARMTAAVAAAYALLATLVVMPLARDGASSDLVARYSHLAGGDTDREVVFAVLSHPLSVLGALFEGGRLWSLALMLVVCSPVALRAPLLALPAVLLIAAAALSGHPQQHRFELHYAATAVVALFAVAASLPPQRGVTGATGLAALVAALAAFTALSPLRPWHEEGSPSTAHRAAIAAAVDLIPAGEPVAAQSNLLAHLSQRRKAYEFPDTIPVARWFIFDDHGHISSQSLAGGFHEARKRIETETVTVFHRDGVEVRRRVVPAGRD